MLDAAFIAANALALIGWFTLIALPNLPLTTKLAEQRVLPLLVTGIYLATFIASYADGPSAGDFFSLDGVAALVSDRVIALVVWVHVLVFDLFVGSHILLDARRRGVSHWVVAPCLVFTLLVGPLGYLSYRIALWVRGRREVSSPS